MFIRRVIRGNDMTCHNVCTVHGVTTDAIL